MTIQLIAPDGTIARTRDTNRKDKIGPIVRKWSYLYGNKPWLRCKIIILDNNGVEIKLTNIGIKL